MSCFIYFNVCNFAYIASPFFSPFRSSIPVRVRFVVGPPHICFFISWSIERGICRDFLFTETGASNHSDPGRLAGRQHSYSKQSARSAPPGPADDGAVQEANLPPWKEVNARRGARRPLLQINPFSAHSLLACLLALSLFCSCLRMAQPER